MKAEVMMKNKASFTYPVLTDKHLAALQKCLAKRDISFPDEGGVTRELEKKLKSFFNVDYVLTMNNGTATLHSAFFAVGEGYEPAVALKGKEILCPSFTWWASILPAINCGATVRFAEISAETLMVDPQDLERKINPNTAAIVVPHLFGQVTDLDEIKRIAEQYHVPIIEDASHVLGAYWRDKPVGTLFDIGCFSMQAGKPLCAGEGGIFLTGNKKYYERALLLGHYERARKELTDTDLAYLGLGYKHRISPLCAALALVETENLEERLQKENELHQMFYAALEKIPSVRVPRQKSPFYRPGGHFSYRILIDMQDFRVSKADLIAALKARGVPIENEFYPLLHTHKVFADKAVNYGYGKLPLTEKVLQNSFGMPIFREGTSAEAVAEYAEVIAQTLDELRRG